MAITQNQTPFMSSMALFGMVVFVAMHKIRPTPVSQLTMKDLNQHTLEKTHYLKSQGYNVIEMWECNLKGQLEGNSEMKLYSDNFEIAEPLEPRHAFYGG